MSDQQIHDFFDCKLWDIQQFQVDGHVIQFGQCEDGRAVLSIDHTRVEFNDNEHRAVAMAMLRDAPQGDGMFGCPAHVSDQRVEASRISALLGAAPDIHTMEAVRTSETEYKRQKIAELDAEIARRRELLGDAHDAIAFTGSYEALRDELAASMANEQAGERVRQSIVNPADDYLTDVYDVPLYLD